VTNGWEFAHGTTVVNAKIAIALFAVCHSQMLTHAIEFIELSGPDFASKVSANSMLHNRISRHKNPYEMCDIYRISPNAGRGYAPAPNGGGGKPPSYPQ